MPWIYFTIKKRKESKKGVGIGKRDNMERIYQKLQFSIKQGELMKKIFSLIFCTCTLLYCQVAIEKGTFRFEGKDYECVRIENGKIRITVIPALGGRIAEITDRSDNLNVVKFGNYGGFLDDHEARTVERYEYEIHKSQENDSVSLRMWNVKNEITYMKTITVYQQKPLVEVEYEILNASQEDLGKV